MAKHKSSDMDRTFRALADPTRRGVLQRLMDEPGLSVSDLARPFSLKLPGMTKHLDVLSDAGLITRTKTGRTVAFRLLNGEEHNPTGIYQEVVPEKTLVFTWDLPGARERESLVTFRLEPFDGGTVLTLTHEQLPDEEARTSHEKGWNGLLDKL